MNEPSDTTEAIIFCPTCGARYVVDAALVRGDVGVLCTACGRGSRVDEGHIVAAGAVDDDRVGNAIRDARRPRVVVGHEVPAAARTIADTLRRGGYAPVCVRTGDEVLAALDPAMPAEAAAVVLDVGIPGVLAFEIVEALRRQPSTSSIPVILLASVYERTRYKRRPNRLYGADTYLELHHVPDRLVDVVDAALHAGVAGSERAQAPVDRARAAGLRVDAVEVGDDDTARALARRLLSDVALYHGDEVARGIKDGAPFGGISDAVAAARDLHEKAGGAVGIFDVELASFASRLVNGRAVGRPIG
ncbi:MAG TPA: hypothetical protein VGF99_07845 [Myxococcota bacterium]